MTHLDCHCGREKKAFRCVDVAGLLSRSDRPSLAGQLWTYPVVRFVGSL